MFNRLTDNPKGLLHSLRSSAFFPSLKNDYFDSGCGFGLDTVKKPLHSLKNTIKERRESDIRRDVRSEILSMEGFPSTNDTSFMVFMW